MGMESMPLPDEGSKNEEEQDKGFKVVDKRVGAKAVEEVEEEIKKKKFDSMTTEQREEMEYKKDKERGFTVKDKRRVTENIVDISEFKKNEESEQESKESEDKEKESDVVEKNKKQVSKSSNEKTIAPFYGWKEEIDNVNDEIDEVKKQIKKSKEGARKFLVPGKKKLLDSIRSSQDKLSKISKKYPRGGAVRDNLNIEVSRLNKEAKKAEKDLGKKGILKRFSRWLFG